MKKLIFPIAAFLLVAGAANAQSKDVAKTAPKHTTTTKKTATVNKATSSNTTTVSPGTTKTTNSVAIKRKHPKKKKAAKKG